MCESRPGSHSVFSNIRARESDGNRLSRCSSNQMHVQAMQHLAFSLFTAKIYSRSVHSCRHVGAPTCGRSHADACTICCMQPAESSHPTRVAFTEGPIRSVVSLTVL